MAPPSPVMSLDPSVPVSPQDIKAQAQSLAQQLFIMPEPQKDSELRALKQKNELLHQQTKAELEKLRTQTRMAGGEILKQQQGGAPAAV
jgi:predicted phosphoribosyltransferase